MAGPSSATAWWPLTRLFLRQFLDNDIVSPHADRSQLLAGVGAAVVSLTLFISVFLSAPYAMSRLTPGEAAVLTLNDKFFYVSLAMLVAALVAAAQWDTLALDHRDAAILDPLPVRPAVVRWAKLSAVALLGAGVAVAVNVFPSLVFPWMLSFAVRQMRLLELLWLMGTHFAVTVTAAVFGFVAVMALRESLCALLGPRLFARVSPALQASSIVLLGSLVLLLPAASTRIAQRGFEGWRAQLPPTAWVALHEMATNAFLADLPRLEVNPRMARRDQVNAQIYSALRPSFAPTARQAPYWLGGAFGVLIAGILVSALRAPIGGVLLGAGGRRWRVGGRLATLLVRRQAARAGFQFAMATLFRSKTHRLAMACAAAVGLAMVFVMVSRLDLPTAPVTTGLLVIQPLLYGSMLVAFRHVVRVPAELRANWAVQMAWGGRVRAFASGAQAAALAGLALPAIAVTVPPIALASGVPLAAAQALLGLVGAAILLEALMLSYDGVPFACSYLPGDGMRVLVPILAAAFLIGAVMFARLQLAILNGAFTYQGIAGLVLLLISLRVASSRRIRNAQVEFDEPPVLLQQLGLHA